MIKMSDKRQLNKDYSAFNVDIESGLFGTFLCCEDCRAVCHTQCKAKLPMPCIPFRKPNGKSSQMVLIADFAPQSRPMIPALIIHCCNEIEKRGLNEEGIYRKCGSDKDVRELKDKILKSKTGIPVLSHYDIHVLCGVIKQFLQQLDEPIVTRILWRDFVRASDQENPDQEKALMQTVEELPTANRDSLAFLMVHLTRVSQAEGNQMEFRGLAKIFGPTIVGHSMVDPPMTEILAENPKQIKVMEALFRIPEEYWNGILTATNSWETNRYGSPDRRMTASGRLLGTAQRVGKIADKMQQNIDKILERNRLENLEDRSEMVSKRVGASGNMWWRVFLVLMVVLVMIVMIVMIVFAASEAKVSLDINF